MAAFIITLLIISQIVSFYLIIKRLNPQIIKPKGIVLKPLPKIAIYEDIDPNFNIVYDVLKTIKIEDWKVDFEDDFQLHGQHYKLNFVSHDVDINVRSRIRIDDEGDISYLSFTITGGCQITINKDSSIKNDIVLFLWDYIVEYHEKKYNDSVKYYEDGIKKISSKLKTLNRSRRLDEILL
jgi:hypothetical protein